MCFTIQSNLRYIKSYQHKLKIKHSDLTNQLLDKFIRVEPWQPAIHHDSQLSMPLSLAPFQWPGNHLTV